MAVVKIQDVDGKKDDDGEPEAALFGVLRQGLEMLAQ